MIKKTFGAGVNLPPEFLNALEDLSYSKPSNEVGHLPLPPNYDSMKMIDTFIIRNEHSSGEHEYTINLGDWNRNTVIRHALNRGIEKLTINGFVSNGFILYMPYPSNDITVVYNGNNYKCHNGSALLFMSWEYNEQKLVKVYEIPSSQGEAYYSKLHVSGEADVVGLNISPWKITKKTVGSSDQCFVIQKLNSNGEYEDYVVIRNDGMFTVEKNAVFKGLEIKSFPQDEPPSGLGYFRITPHRINLCGGIGSHGTPKLDIEEFDGDYNVSRIGKIRFGVGQNKSIITSAVDIDIKELNYEDGEILRIVNNGAQAIDVTYWLDNSIQVNPHSYAAFIKTGGLWYHES